MQKDFVVIYKNTRNDIFQVTIYINLKNFLNVYRIIIILNQILISFSNILTKLMKIVLRQKMIKWMKKNKP